MCQQLAKAAILLIQQSLFLLHLIVVMYLSLHRSGSSNWARAVARLGRSIEEAGVAIYMLISDHFTIPGAAPLVRGVFPLDLTFQTVVERAEQLGAYVPFVHFLDLHDVSFFELGHRH